ncbi:ribosome hibernation-promoting factor, HPF/YfiA family [Raineyella fluvialis]|uniref:ribosome hibernation-promoting factor, HPF/YfiA family n=1 Tax=Raineyella fluvialis TaxID=2662261 RepID=UPI001EF0399A|nr:ribosome-associated translation inhibitor RaiA [Raineyella fluvialis]
MLDKIGKIERLRDRVIRVDVQLSSYGTEKQPNQTYRTEITLLSKGPVVRSEAADPDKFASFELAMDRLRAQLRRASDRRKVHHGRRRPTALYEAAMELPELTLTSSDEVGEDETRNVAGIEVTGEGPLVVREKSHPKTPMTLAQALDQMELVGHDFFLFQDADAGVPSVVYRRKGYSYGVLRLDGEVTEEERVG